MAAVTKIEAFETSDGQVFKDRTEARKHQTYLNKLKGIKKWISTWLDMSDTNPTFKDITDALIKHGDELAAILRQ